jgi:hypothetical protein
MAPIPSSRQRVAFLALVMDLPLLPIAKGEGGRMDDQPCPVCDGKAILSFRTFPTPAVFNSPAVQPGPGQVPLAVSCAQCGEFTAVEGFFPHEWATIPAADKAAIAVYLQQTKERLDWTRELSPQSWRRMASQGKRWSLALSPPC